jgi:hypothetical protein
MHQLLKQFFGRTETNRQIKLRKSEKELRSLRSSRYLILTPSTACECLETSEFRLPKVEREFSSSSLAISSNALIPDPYMVFSFPTLPRSSSVALMHTTK